MNEYLVKLSEELRQISEELAVMRTKYLTMEHGPEKKKLKREIKDKQWQASFYIDKIKNLSQALHKNKF